MVHYGIDLGTSSCLVSKVIQNLDDSFEVKCLTDEDGEDSFPSVVSFENEEKYMVGNTALQTFHENPDSAVELVKLRLGKTSHITFKTPAGTFQKSPQEITSLLLNHLNVIHNNQIENAVITVPAFFDQGQKDATMQAGVLANIKPMFLIEEPTAAIMYHMFSQYADQGIDLFNGVKEKNVLVFDFGGGTLDLSLIGINIYDNEIVPKVLAIGGDTNLGGSIIDFIFTQVILNLLKNKYPSDDFILNVCEAFEDYYYNYKTNHTLRFTDGVTDEVKNFIYRLKRNLEQIKIKLSSANEADIYLEKHYEKIIISRENFEKYVLMNDDDLSITDRIKAALQNISCKRIPISEVLLIGGSSQIPLIKEIIFETFEEMRIPREMISLSRDFEKAVVKGAAIQAAISSGEAIPPFMHNKCESIVARDIEIEHAGKSRVFVPMGTAYPFEERKKFIVSIGHALSETVSLRLNEIVEQADNQKEINSICNFQFYLPIYYTNDKISVFMNIDEAGLYQIEAIHEETKEAVEFEPHKEYSLSAKELNIAAIKVKQMTDIS